jgi:hypothetical protein
MFFLEIPAGGAKNEVQIFKESFSGITHQICQRPHLRGLGAIEKWEVSRHESVYIFLVLDEMTVASFR